MVRSDGVLDRAGLQALLGALAEQGYVLIGPTVRDGAIVAAQISSVADLPRGITDEQAPGRYRLHHSDNELLFAYAAAATGWKSQLFPARRALWRLSDNGAPEHVPVDDAKRALIGVRPCDLRAMAIHDRVLARGTFIDPDYAARRGNTFIVAVACSHPAATCFCSSMGTGPAPSDSCDLAMTELLDGDGHRFVVECHSDEGADLLASLPTRPVRSIDRQAAAAAVTRAEAQMRRHVDVGDIRELLYENAEHPRWDEVAQRCLACTNCTLVCPTCFCVTVDDVGGLLTPIGRDRVWDSCFNEQHSQLHGGPVRDTTRARYRQWLTHKFASWIDQFGTSGCVGCGRCIAWCPVGIDVTEELAALRTGPQQDGDSR